MSANSKRGDERAPQRTKRPSKKEQILSLFLSGMGEVEDIAIITGSRPSYVGSVLQEAGLVSGYFDLYTSTAHPMNVYSKFFANKLGFKDEETAQAAVEVIERLYRQFELAGDRAGQHHALVMALTMFDRARWTGKGREAEIFRRWLGARLDEATLTNGDDAPTGDDDATGGIADDESADDDEPHREDEI
ncbi:MAG TPA: hypothetical protein VNA19_08405 [Pyrinomonadaceae bacterium]|jgi:hypothetical protein|nr:hypothetical protein [Pyrinomonadaceae bacterium]